MVITCKYERLKASRSELPIFVGFKSNNRITLTLASTLGQEKVQKLLRLMSQWFEQIRVEKIEEK